MHRWKEKKPTKNTVISATDMTATMLPTARLSPHCPHSSKPEQLKSGFCEMSNNIVISIKAKVTYCMTDVYKPNVPYDSTAVSDVTYSMRDVYKRTLRRHRGCQKPGTWRCFTTEAGKGNYPTAPRSLVSSWTVYGPLNHPQVPVTVLSSSSASKALLPFSFFWFYFWGRMIVLRVFHLQFFPCL